jgi:hypothetical protein
LPNRIFGYVAQRLPKSLAMYSNNSLEQNQQLRRESQIKAPKIQVTISPLG